MDWFVTASGKLETDDDALGDRAVNQAEAPRSVGQICGGSDEVWSLDFETKRCLHCRVHAGQWREMETVLCLWRRSSFPSIHPSMIHPPPGDVTNLAVTFLATSFAGTAPAFASAPLSRAHGVVPESEMPGGWEADGQGAGKCWKGEGPLPLPLASGRCQG